MAPKSPWNKKATAATNLQRNKTTETTSSTAINYGEVQNDEIEALQAIYEDFEEVEVKGTYLKDVTLLLVLNIGAASAKDYSFVKEL